MKKIISESKKRNYVAGSGIRYRTKMIVTLLDTGKKKKNGKPKYYSSTSFEPIFN